MIQQAIAKLVERKNLTEREAEAAMEQIMHGEATPAQIGAFLATLRMKGETVEEVAGCAKAMRRSATPVRPKCNHLVDTCGTGGDRSGTFNVSTTVAFVVAACGYAVAKHGNRAVSGRCGSADVLQALGADLDLDAEQVAACIDTVGFGFLFAPRFHPAMKHAIGPRRELGVRTIFNILGPLTNPAGVQWQLIGVYDERLAEPMAYALDAVGVRAAYIVHGADGLDELTTTGTNRVTHLLYGKVCTFTLDPADLGFPRARLTDLAGGDARESATILRRILSGEERGPRRDVVLLNAAAALSVETGDLRAGLIQAQEALDSGRALERLEHFIAFSNSFRAA
jgi:anthranilate phosphoribosyltransferase